MKKFITALLLGALALVLVACGSDKKEESDDVSEGADGDTPASVESEDEEKVKLFIGATNVPHAVILEEAQPLLLEEGIELVIEEYTDYVLPNMDLNDGEIDANFFQHIPYMESFNEDHGFELVNAGGIHIEPMGVYSKEYDSLEELPEGATILISNSVADHGRVLGMLEAQGLIGLAEGVDKAKAEVSDIIDNPKNIVFDANYEAALLPQLFNNDEGDAVLINSNYAIDAGLNPLEDSIAIEEADSPYVNVVVVHSGDEEKKAIKKLVEILTSQEIQDFILEEWEGSVVPIK